MIFTHPHRGPVPMDTPMRDFFNRWQRLYIGRMLTFLMFVVTGAVILWLLHEFAQAVSFLQPVLIPLAVAAVIAFLAEPVVRVICAKTRWGRTTVVLCLMGFCVLAAAAVGVWIVPRAYASTAQMIRDTPAFMRKAEARIFGLVESAEKKVRDLNSKLPPAPVPGPLTVSPKPGEEPQPVNASDASTPAPTTPAAQPGGNNASPVPSNLSTGPTAAPENQIGKKEDGMSSIDLNKDGRFDSADIRQWLSGQLPELGDQIPHFLQKTSQIAFRAFGGFLGLFGVLINVIIIPIYIFFLLTEARKISKTWADYLPLKDSKFKQEIVSTLSEIHGYLVAFFRGQLIVSSIDAVLIATSLWLFVGLNFSVVIGLLVLVLTFIPYLGILLCYIPAVLIAVVQFGDWQHPLLVIVIMFAVQTLESTIIAPKIVGESTGLHPLTVIISVFAWELLLDGPIGALLAVPLTAALKVIMRRYVWERARARARILPTADVQPVLRAGDRDRFGDGSPDIQAVPDAVAHPQDKPDAPATSDTANPPSGKKD